MSASTRSTSQSRPVIRITSPRPSAVSDARFSAGFFGDSTAAVGQTVISTALSVDPLVRVSTDLGVSVPLTAEELATSGHVTLDSQTEPMVSVNQSNGGNVVGMWQ